MLKLKKICKNYKTGDFVQHALKDVSLDFESSEFVAILGASGSGKTTCLNIIGGLDRYDKGDLIINGSSTKKFKDKDWDAYRNNSIGFIFQSYNLITHISVLANVEMCMTLSGISKSKRKQKAMEALEKVGLKEHAHKRPNQLSGGQAQRVAIARALVNDPDIILADEPTGALDSETSVQIMNLIKDISKDKLVIMVTHNPDLAKEYTNRVITLKDGEVISDTKEKKLKKVKQNEYKMRRTSMNFFSALGLSFSNIWTKKGRTLLTAFASSIGIIGIAMILALSNGFDKQIDKFEQDTLTSFPISVSHATSQVNEDQMKQIRSDFISESNIDDKYKDIDVVYPYDAESAIKTHKNKITADYVKYVKNMDKNLVDAVDYMRVTSMNLLNKVDNKVNLLESTAINLKALPEAFDSENEYLTNNYDVLSGKLPKNKNEIVVIVDNKNRVDKALLESLGIDEKQKEIKISEFIDKEFKLILNNDYYKSIGNELYIANTNYKDMYKNENAINLKIVGVLKAKEDNKIASMNTAFAEMSGLTAVSSLSYTNELIEYVISKNSESDIVKSQKKSDGAVFMGGLSFDKAGYSKEQVMSMLGAYDEPLMINIYPKDFENKEAVNSYLEKYNDGKKEEDQVIYTDYAKTFAELSGDIMDAITYVLVGFSAISLVVSSIMIGIITYISVLERTKEIGILRALGARKKDITRVFNAETFIIGLCSGLLGVIIARLLIIPANIILEDLTNLKSVAVLNPLHAILLILISLTLTVIGGFIPAKIAAKKDPVIALRTE